MNAGTVLLIKDFKFQDGTQKDKLLIVLNNPKDDEPFLLCPATSQQWRKSKILGCHSDDNYFYIDENQDKFLKNTWIVFHKLYSYSAALIVKESFQQNLFKKFAIEPTLWQAIKNCILQSKDIEIEYLEMIKRN